MMKLIRNNTQRSVIVLMMMVYVTCFCQNMATAYSVAELVVVDQYDRLEPIKLSFSKGNEGEHVQLNFSNGEKKLLDIRVDIDTYPMTIEHKFDVYNNEFEKAAKYFHAVHPELNISKTSNRLFTGSDFFMKLTIRQPENIEEVVGVNYEIVTVSEYALCKINEYDNDAFIVVNSIKFLSNGNEFYSKNKKSEMSVIDYSHGVRSKRILRELFFGDSKQK